jgi:hypothetical protein
MEKVMGIITQTFAVSAMNHTGKIWVTERMHIAANIRDCAIMQQKNAI